jgi:hypothetical protein
MTDARHGNSILKNEQQVFTLGMVLKKPEEMSRKVLECQAHSPYL